MIFRFLLKIAFFLLASHQIHQVLAQENKPIPQINSSLANDLKKIKTNLLESLSQHPVIQKKVLRIDWDNPTHLHQKLIECLEEIPEIKKVLNDARTANTFSANSLPPFYGMAHVRLEVAMILVKKNQHGLASQILGKIDKSNLVQPDLAYLYEAICLHQSVNLEQAMERVEVLIVNRSRLPIRYAAVVESLYNDLKKHESQPLHTIARLMADVSRRQNQRQSNDVVLQQEEQIIQKLDDAIKDLERKSQQVKTQTKRSNKPQPAGRQSGGSGNLPKSGGSAVQGDVTSKNQDTTSEWGQITKEEKLIAVKTLMRELPPHFQSLLEAYFQKLAEETK